MCGRYTLHHSADAIAKRYNLATTPTGIIRNYNVSPGQRMPIITANQAGLSQFNLMKWGLVPFWAKDPRIGYKLINARDDTIFEKPAWRTAILHRRCLVPADGFYEWRHTITDNAKEYKQPYYIRPKQLGIFSFAGIWDVRNNTDGTTLATFSIVTTEPNKEMVPIHNRMPVLLHQEDEATWLAPSNVTRSSIEPLLRPYEDGELDIYKVSDDVNSPRHNDSHLIYALE